MTRKAVCKQSGSLTCQVFIQQALFWVALRSFVKLRLKKEWASLGSLLMLLILLAFEGSLERGGLFFLSKRATS